MNSININGNGSGSSSSSSNWVDGVGASTSNGHNDTPFVSPCSSRNGKSSYIRRSRPRKKGIFAAADGFRITNFSYGLDFLDDDDEVDENKVDLDFEYGDADDYMAEMAELYSYNELSEFSKNLGAFESILTKWSLPLQWKGVEERAKENVVQKLLNQLDLADRAARHEALKAILYIAQGCWSEIRTPEDHGAMVRENVLMLTRNGTFAAVTESLALEMDLWSSSSIAPPTYAGELATILNIMYTIVETICTSSDEDSRAKDVRILFISQLNFPENKDDEPIAVKLWKIATSFTEGRFPALPIKKVLLLLWKILVLSLGGISELWDKKNEYRALAGLSKLDQDTVVVGKSTITLQTMTEAHKEARIIRRSLVRQENVSYDIGKENGSSFSDDVEDVPNNGAGNGLEAFRSLTAFFRASGRSRMESGNLPASLSRSSPSNLRRVPWTPKTRFSDVDAFLKIARDKFIGISFPGDRDTVTGLPPNIIQGVAVLKQYLHVPLNECQVGREFQLQKTPLTAIKNDLERCCRDSPAEALYSALLPNLPQHLTGLLKILLSAAAQPSYKNARCGGGGLIHDEGCVNVLGEVFSPRSTETEAESSLKPKVIQAVDITRHKEIVTKAVSAILLLVLKHCKLAHVYQFEYICQHLTFANCIPVILKYLNQDMHEHITLGGECKARDMDLASFEFPACVLTTSEWTAEPCSFSRRNLFSSINLLRILNKLCKWKPARVTTLLGLKAPSTLCRALKVRHPIMQLYVLKLMKMQSPYLRRGFRRANLKLMTAIYMNVRPRLNDNWAYGEGEYDCEGGEEENSSGGGGGGSGSGSFEEEESKLWANIEQYHLRRFEMAGNKPAWFASNSALAYVSASLLPAASGSPTGNLDLKPTPAEEYDIEEVLAPPYELSPGFKAKYEQWLEKEVFLHPIDWDEVLNGSNGLL